MKILSPCSKKEEVLPLIQAGADELYCGIIPVAWSKRYGIFDTLNRREGHNANFSRMEDLQDAVGLAHAKKVSVFVTMNGLYSEEQYPLIKKIILNLRDIGVDGWVIADVGLLLMLKKMKLGREIHMGTGGTVFNYRTASFYKKLGATRVVLDRHLAMDEIHAIADGMHARMELEVFILNTPCPNVDGLCTFYHGLKLNDEIAQQLETDNLKVRFYDTFDVNYGGHGCILNYSTKVFSERGKIIKRKIRALPKTNKGCGACAIFDFYKMGINALKIVERAIPIETKLRDTKFIRCILDLLKRNPNISRDEFMEESQRRYCSTYQFAACSGFDCYYPSLFNVHGGL